MAQSRLPVDASRVPELRGDPVPLADHLQRLIAAPESQFEAGFSAFVIELEQALNEELASCSKTDAESLARHRDLHCEILRLLGHARERMLEGDDTLARKVMGLLPKWLGDCAPVVAAPAGLQVRVNKTTAPATSTSA